MANHGKEHHHGEHHGHEHHEQFHVEHGRKPWRWHRDWRLWVAVVLMVVAMLVYVMSLDDALLPNQPAQQPVPAAP